jgi:hypothetical protein
LRRNEFVDLDFLRMKVATSELERIYGSEVTLSYQLKNLRRSEECDDEYKDDILGDIQYEVHPSIDGSRRRLEALVR